MSTARPPSRRRALLAGAAGLASACLPAGAYGILRNRYGITADIYIPKVNTVTQIPLDVTRFEEAPFCQLRPDGMLGVLERGLYRVLLSLDWKAQAGTDIDLRMYGIRRKLASDPGGPLLSDERLASYDVPGADSPVAARYSGTWAPPVVPLGGVVFVDVTVATPGQSVVPGDVAQAALAAAVPSRIGTEAALALQVRAQVIARNTVRVMLSNSQVAGGIQVPEGTLNVLAQSTTGSRGDSEDAWNVVDTPMTELFPGDRLYIAAKNLGVNNDYVQATPATFMQVERFG